MRPLLRSPILCSPIWLARCLLGSFVLLAGLVCGCAGSSAGDAESGSPGAHAAQLAAHGRALFARGRYALACDALQRSYEASPSTSLLLELGECYELKPDSTAARAVYEGVLQALPSEPDQQWAAKLEPIVRQRLHNLRLGRSPGPGQAEPRSAALSPPAAGTAGARWPDLSSGVQASEDGRRDTAVIVAIESYAFLPPIPGAVANGRDWFVYLTRSRQVPVGRVRFLSDTEATDFAISRAVGEASSAAVAGGRVWFVFIGHGAPSRTGEGLLVAADAHQSVDGLENRSLLQSKVLAQLAASAATPVAIIDACFSGRLSDGTGLIAGLQPSNVVTTSTPERAVLLTAAASNQYAGPLPGDSRPAFSYLVLGALRGWGDADQDGAVTAQEVVDYSRTVFMTLLAGSRTQTPEARGQRSLPLARASERGPELSRILLDLKAMPAAPTPRSPLRTQPSSTPQLPQPETGPAAAAAAKTARCDCRAGDLQCALRCSAGQPGAVRAEPDSSAGGPSPDSAHGQRCGSDPFASRPDVTRLAVFTVEGPPSAEVYIDGERCGNPPLRRMIVPPGLHRLVIRSDKGITKRFTLHLDAGKHEMMRVEFED